MTQAFHSARGQVTWYLCVHKPRPWPNVFLNSQGQHLQHISELGFVFVALVFIYFSALFFFFNRRILVSDEDQHNFNVPQDNF